MKQLIYLKIYTFTLDYLVKGFYAMYVVELMSSCLVFGAGTACRPYHSRSGLHHSAQSSEENMPEDRGKTKASGTFKESTETDSLKEFG